MLKKEDEIVITGQIAVCLQLVSKTWIYIWTHAPSALGYWKVKVH